MAADDFKEELEEIKDKLDDINENFEDVRKISSNFKSTQRSLLSSIEKIKSPLLSAVASITTTALNYGIERKIVQDRIKKLKTEENKNKEKLTTLVDTVAKKKQENSILTASIKSAQDREKKKKQIEDEINAKQSEIAKIAQRQANGQKETLAKWEQERKAREELRKLKEDNSDIFTNDSELSTLQEQLKQNEQTLEESEQSIKELTASVETTSSELKEYESQLGKLNTTKLLQTTLSLTEALNKFIGTIRQTQQEFGIAGGQALKLQFNNLMLSVQSAFGALTGEMFVSAKEIGDVQSSFRKEFGGLITSESAKELAQRAKELGVTSEELAKARRVFLTSSMGNLATAKAAEERTITAFRRQGLTNKDAYELIAQYSELYARNGARFAASFTRAAADAKKIGVDLNKVSQFGDSIIGDFEGFLERSAELGAMGFGIDANRLAQIAETASDADLFNALRSELASMGKDITRLRRSERLALEDMFGMTISDMQRMASPTGGEKLTPQEETNTLLSNLISIAEGLTVIGGVVQTGLLTSIAYFTSLTAAATSAKIPAALGTLGSVFGYGLAGMAGVLGGSAIGMGMGGTALGSSTGSIIGTILGGIAGSFFGPGGTMIGMSLGGMAGGALGGYVTSGDDVVSKPGYGDRMLVTPTSTIALNNSDNIIAYADDLISGISGATKYPLGTLNNNNSGLTEAYITRMEAKLDQLVRAIGSMEVKMDGKEVGKVLINSSERVMVRGNQRLTGTSL